MAARKQFMLTLPFAVRDVSKVLPLEYANGFDSCSPTLLVVTEKYGKLIELECGSNRLLIPLIGSHNGFNMHELNNNLCYASNGSIRDNARIIVQGPHVVVYTHRGLFNKGIAIAFRNSGCKRWDHINRAVVVKSGSDLVSSFVLYRRAGEYFLILDTVDSFIHVRLGEKPSLIKHRNGVIIAFFRDYARLLSPVTGFIDIPSSEQSLEPLGYSLEGNILLYNKSDSVVYAIDRVGGIKPLIRCVSISSIPSYDGYSIIECDGRVVGGVGAVASYALSLVKRASFSYRSVIVFPYVVLLGKDNISIIELGRMSTVIVDILSEVVRRNKVLGLGSGIGDDSDAEKLVTIIENEIVGSLTDAEILINRAVLWRTKWGSLCIGSNSCSNSILEVWGRVLGIQSNSYGLKLVLGGKRVEPSVVYVDNDRFYAAYSLHGIGEVSSVTIEEYYSRASTSIDKINVREISVGIEVLDAVPRGIDTIELTLRVSSNLGMYKLFILPWYRIAKPAKGTDKRNGRPMNGYELVFRASVAIDEVANNNYEIGIMIASEHGIKIIGQIDVRHIISSVFGVMSDVNATINDGHEFIEMASERPGYIAFRVNGVDVVVESGGAYVLRVPGGRAELAIRDSRGVRIFTLFGIKDNIITAKLVGGNALMIECNISCVISCRHSTPLSGNVITLDVNKVINSGTCSIISIGYGVVKEYNVNGVGVLMGLGVKTGLLLAKLLKL
ncbi:hypothetical protein [Pyrodictium abyssi]|uniref:Uncharacterized protein n=1 Tax=Pyrodictium abyssi TaxID=54256 RepID=A0ABN6ZMI2_9CREN|nr:hypothetical protein PABY_10430 [Pyrodictium abyssi]